MIRPSIITIIIFTIVIIALIILYISLNPFEIKEKFVGYEEEPMYHDPTDFQGTLGDHYEIRTIAGTNDRYIKFKTHSGMRLPVDFPNCSILVIGGGGGGSAGGGGAGGFLYITNQTLTAGTYVISVGSGGIGAIPDVSRGGDGNDSFISKDGTDLYRAYKGGGGAANSTIASIISGRYGSTGGCGHNSDQQQAIFLDGTLEGGNIGGTSSPSAGTWINTYQSGGGGGGAGGVGGVGVAGDPNNSNSGGRGGHGGVGRQCNITGENVYYSGGGAGGTNINKSTTTQRTAPTGGLGGGGNGNLLDRKGGTSGIPNTGGGGGGSDKDYRREVCNGGSGVVIIRYTPVRIVNPEPSKRTAGTFPLNSINKCLAGIITENPRNEIFDLKETYDINEEADGYTQYATANEGDDEYIIKYSSYGSPEKSPLNLFDCNEGGHFAPRRYNQRTGEFDSGIEPIDFYIVNPTDSSVILDNRTLMPESQRIRGEWVLIRFPNPFILISFSFIANIGWENKAPGAYIVLGRDSNDDDNPYNRIAYYNDSRMTWKDYGNKDSEYKICLNENEELYNEYLFIFPKLASTDLIANIRHGHQLDFKEIRLLKRSTDDTFE